MLKTLPCYLTLLAGLWSSPTWAESWSGEDKGVHFVGSATLAAIVTVASEDPAIGFWSVVALGVTKELVDSRRTEGKASGRDLVADIAGAYLGSQTGRWLIYRRGSTTAVVVSWRF